MTLPAAPQVAESDRRRFYVAIRDSITKLQNQIGALSTAGSSNSNSFASQIAALAARVTALEEALEALQQDTLFVTGITGEGLGGQLPIMAGADGLFYVADITDPDAAEAFVGFTDRDYSSGTQATVQFIGVVEDEDWTWTQQGRIYLGAAGAMTQTKPTSGRVLSLGFALDATKILIDHQLLTVQVRDEAAGVAIVQSRSDGAIDPSLTLGGAGTSPDGIYTGQEGEFKMVSHVVGYTDEFGISGDGYLIEI